MTSTVAEKQPKTLNVRSDSERADEGLDQRCEMGMEGSSWDGLSQFLTIVMPATSNKTEGNQTEETRDGFQIVSDGH